jgi:hypothetical protein
VRIVPDADTIGVLIASWSADDRIEVPAVELRPPSLIPAVAAVAAERRAARSNRQIMLSGFMGDERGGRVQVDLFGRLVPFGIAIATQVDPYRTVNFQATLYSGIDLAFQGWHLRAQVGAGLRVNDVDFVVHVNANAEGLIVGGYDIATDASLLGSRELGDRWMLIGGMLLNVTLQTYRGPMRIEPHAPVAMALLGLGLRL